MRPIVHTAIIAAVLALAAGCAKDETHCAPTADRADAPAGSVVALAASAPPAASQRPTAQPKVDAPAPATTAAKTAPKTGHEPQQDDADEPDLDADLRVKRLVIAHGVKNREPVEPAATFTAGERIYAFIEVGNPAAVVSEVRVSFARVGGKERGSVRLEVGASPRWRTWSYTQQAREAGEWEAIVRDGNGDVIARQRFTVTAADAAPAAPPAAPPAADAPENKRA
jgi:hypothetical protein